MFYQTNEHGLFVGQSPYSAKGFGDVDVAPPAAQAGYVARWESTVERADASYGDAGTGEWVLAEGNRTATLYTADGQQYTIGADHDGHSYDGLGPVPSWLTDTAPEPEPAPPVYPQLTALEMLDLFTESEQLAVVQATMANAAVKLWYDRLIAANFVTYEDPRTEGGLQALVDVELISAQRKEDIVAAMQPASA